MAVNDGKFSINVEAKGLTANEIDDVQTEVKFQPDILERTQAGAWKKDHAEIPVGNARAMILRGTDNNNAYLYLQSDDAEFSAVVLHYEQAGAWKTMHDAAFPFEFTVPLPGMDATFPFYLEGRTVDGNVIQSKEEVLQREDR